MDIANLFIRVATDQVDRARDGVKGLGSDLQHAESYAERFGNVVGSSMKIAVGAIVGLVGGLGTLAVAMGKHIDDLGDLGDAYGFSVTQIAAMKTQAEASGGSLEDVMKAAQKARSEISKGGDAFKSLGIAMRDSNGELKSGVQLASEVAQKYRDGSTTAAQFADVQSVLGKNVDKTAAVLAGQASAIELVNELQSKGIGIYEQASTATDAHEKAMNKAQLVMESAGSIIVAKVLPAFTSLITTLTDSYVNGGLVRQAFDALIATIPGLIDFGGVIAKVFGTAMNVVRAFGKTIGAVGAAVVALFEGNFSGAKVVFDQWKQDVDDIDAANNAFKKGVDSTTAAMKQAVDVTKKLTIAKQENGRASKGEVPVSDKDKDKSKYKGSFRDKAAEDEYKSYAHYAREIDKLLEDREEQERRAALTKRNLQNQTDAYVRSVGQEVEEYRISVEVLARYGAKQDDASIAVAKYRVQIAQATRDVEGLSGAQLDQAEAALRAAQANLDGLQGKKDIDTNAAGPQEGIDGLMNGWTRAFAQYRKDAENTASVGAQAFESASQSMGDAFADFVTTGKLNFKSLASSILADLARILAQKAIVAAISMFKNGGAFAGGTQLFAGGGVVSSPTAFGMAGGRMGVMGEAGPEAIMPLKRGTDGKLGVASSGQKGGGDVHNTYSITVSVGSVDSQDKLNQLQQTLKQTIVNITTQTVMDMRRPGNLLAT